MNIKNTSLLTLLLISSVALNGLSSKFNDKIKNMSDAQLAGTQNRLQAKLNDEIKPLFNQKLNVVQCNCVEGRAYNMKCPQYEEEYRNAKYALYVTQDKLAAIQKELSDRVKVTAGL